MKKSILSIALALCLCASPAWAISHWQDVVLVGRPLTPVVGASVTVYLQGTTTKATIYSDRPGSVSITNPVTTDATGVYSFYVAEGRYDLLVTAAGLANVTRSDVGIFDWSASPSFTGMTLNGELVFASGFIRLPNGIGILQKDTGGAYRNLIEWQGANHVYVGDTNAADVSPGAGDNVIPLGQPTARWSTGYFGTGGLVVGTNPSTTGLLNFSYSSGVYFRNQGNALDIALIRSGVQTSNDVTVGEVSGNIGRINLLGADILWGKALVALGGGAAPTVGTIGGSGPATAAQNSWMRVLDSNGVAFWVPVWK